MILIGHDFVNEAIENGATAVVLDMNADLKNLKIKLFHLL